MSTTGQFEALQAFWNSMTDKERAELTHNIEEFTNLVNKAKRTGEAESDLLTGEVTIYKHTPETRRIAELVTICNLESIKVKYKVKKTTT